MEAKLQEKISDYVHDHKINDAIDLCEELLIKEDKTPFHRIVGKNILHMNYKLKNWLNNFHQKVSKEKKIKTIYCEMNELVKNPDLWYIDAFAYEDKRQPADLNWLLNWNKEKRTTPFVISGFEDIQIAFKHFKQNIICSSSYIRSAELCKELVILRTLELFENIKESENEKITWCDVNLLSSASGSDVVLETK